ncbi:phage portal protein [Edwardsiella tarda]|uniref:phage portal protein n=1 Tax=Edwardsiella tarda TaxID=636 RepID=UPI0034DCF104
MTKTTKKAKATTADHVTGAHKMSLITFGDPERVISHATDYQSVMYDDYNKYYQPPVDRLALSELPNLNGQHGGILRARVNMVCSDFISGGNMTLEDMLATITNLLTFGDVGLLKIRNRLGGLMRLHPLPSLYLRRRRDGGITILQKGNPLNYDPRDVVFIRLYDPRQQVYGLPDYLGGINSAMLNSDATTFRRRYYRNGAHLGYIFYSTDPNMTQEMEDEVREKIEKSKGAGNFRSMFINIPNGKPDGVKLIPIGDMGAKDEFVNIKNISMQDILNAHRFPPGLAGMMPNNTGGFPDPGKSRAAYREDEVLPLQRLLCDAIKTDPDIPTAMHLVFKEKQEDKPGKGEK